MSTTTSTTLDLSLENECNALSNLFHTIVHDLKTLHPAWEDVGTKACKLGVQLKATITCLAAFIDSLQKVADHATATKGGTRDIGTALTRLCMRQRAIEQKARELAHRLGADTAAITLTARATDWRQTAVTLDKQHDRICTKKRQHIHKRQTELARADKRAKNGDTHDLTASRRQLVADERQLVRAALVAQRAQYCQLVDEWLRPIVDTQLGVLGEFAQVTEVVEQLYVLTEQPHTLPPSSEAVIVDIQGIDLCTAPAALLSSPTLGSRKSSMCSLASSNCYSPNIMTNATSTPHHPSCNTAACSSQDSGVPAESMYAPCSVRAHHILLPAHGSTASDEDTASSGHTGSFTDHSAAAPSAPVAADTANTPSPTHPAWTLDVDVRRESAATLPVGHHTARPTILPQTARGETARPDSLALGGENGVIFRPCSARPPLPSGRLKDNVSVEVHIRKFMYQTPIVHDTPQIPDYNAMQSDQCMSIYARTESACQQRPRQSMRARPLSFVGDEENMKRLLHVAGTDSYLNTPVSRTAGGTLQRRPSNRAAPTPPARRNSQITAATPTAPSVEVVRANSRCTTPVDGGGSARTSGYHLTYEQQYEAHMLALCEARAQYERSVAGDQSPMATINERSDTFVVQRHDIMAVNTAGLGSGGTLTRRHLPRI